ncbi:uncharacterized protein LOC124933574 [Impatiens glandulifera]|uniref:uncharacterized protein LOC124933574 n=1 Tax=Impatiens glandulifera TaxID=253017 RepID=UPI001FB16C2E|nr:uncharacterized protein LOC124933574 [Impatiens glandulifera]
MAISSISNTCLGIPNLFPKNPISIWRKDNTFKFNIHDSNLRLLRRPFPIHLHLSTTRRLQPSAKFIRPSSRRNSLRKKLNEQLLQQQGGQCPKVLDPILNYDDKESSNVIQDVDGADSSKLNSNNITLPANKEANSGHLGDSVLWNKLETWVDQCKTESEFWGVGFGPIFTIYRDLDGKTKSVIVNEEEILKRCGFSPHKYDRSEFMVSPEAKYKIDHANYLAKEIESGNHAFPESSSVARFVVQGQQSRFLNTIQSLTHKSVLSSKQSKVGIILLLGCFFMVCGLKALFANREAKVEYSRLEKDMLRRKVKARKENEKLEKGNVEVIQDFKEVQISSKERPKINKQEVMEYISKTNLSSLDSSSKPSDFDCRIQEIREMARQVRKDERKDSTPSASDAEAIDSKEEHVNLPNGCSNESKFVVDKITNITTENQKSQTSASSACEDLLKDFYEQKGTSSSTIGLADGESYVGEIKEKKNSETVSSIEVPTVKPKKRFGTRKIISSVDKAREYLSQEHVERKLKEEFNQSDGVLVNSNIEHEATHNSNNLNNGVSIPVKPGGLINSETDHNVRKELRVTKKADANFEDVRKEYTSTDTELLWSVKNEGNHSQLEERPSLSCLSKSEKGGTSIQEPDKDSPSFQSSKCSVENDSAFKPTVGTNRPDIEEGSRDIDDQTSTSAPGIGNKSRNTKDASPMDKGSWIAENFHEMEQVVQMIATGFSENYKVAREKVKQELHVCPDLIRSNVDEYGGELEWMQDDRLREIVFQVRDNELCGRDPFYLMDDEDKLEFFKGLERKVEKENVNLGNLHEWIHSNIENLDYGADGISIYDTPEKIIPRWIGPPVDKIPDFLNNVANRDDMAKKSFNNPPAARKNGQESRNKPQESTLSKHVSPTVAKGQRIEAVNAASKEPNTVIEASDGSSRAGKKSGKEYWQHTKKVSRSFLESYNAETDPEVKADMRNIGKGLDRWITEEEVQEAANFMDKIPEKGREYIEKKLNKVKREMELFGPQAVVSKYKEYSEEKEIDYLWWLDLPYILCLELYTIEDGEEKVGFYSLEMAEDLELDPKPFHVIAFEDPGDCKNLCYIVQAQMEMLGNGSAFVVARPPKDTFRDAKEKGFSITVIKKGEMQLNVDLTLEEVEEQIIEIGSKIYHDSITKERSVDINGLMKGVFGVSKSAKR